MTTQNAASRTCFPEWASAELNRLLNARQNARTPEERGQYELQLALIYDAAHRYGRSLAEVSEL
jgi:hypothetical protein